MLTLCAQTEFVSAVLPDVLKLLIFYHANVLDITTHVADFNVKQR